MNLSLFTGHFREHEHEQFREHERRFCGAKLLYELDCPSVSQSQTHSLTNVFMFTI